MVERKLGIVVLCKERFLGTQKHQQQEQEYVSSQLQTIVQFFEKALFFRLKIIIKTN